MSDLLATCVGALIGVVSGNVLYYGVIQRPFLRLLDRWYS